MSITKKIITMHTVATVSSWQICPTVREKIIMYWPHNVSKVTQMKKADAECVKPAKKYTGMDHISTSMREAGMPTSQREMQ